MPLDTRQLRYFIAVAEELHFTRAAERLGIAPPSLTQQIQSLERMLGAVLFHRTKRTVELSDAGLLFLEEARTALRQVERAETVGRRAGRGEMGVVEIGIVTTAIYTDVLSSTILAFRAKQPNVDVRVREIEMKVVLRELEEERIDIGFVRPPINYGPGLTDLTLMREPIVLALPANHPAARRKTIDPSVLADTPFITADHGIGISYWQHTIDFGKRGGYTPRIDTYGRNLFAVVGLVALGLGVAVVPASMSKCLRLPGLAYRPMSGTPIISELAAAFRRNERGPAARAFIQTLRAVAGKSKLAA